MFRPHCRNHSAMLRYRRDHQLPTSADNLQPHVFLRGVGEGAALSVSGARLRGEAVRRGAEKGNCIDCEVDV